MPYTNQISKYSQRCSLVDIQAGAKLLFLRFYPLMFHKDGRQVLWLRGMRSERSWILSTICPVLPLGLSRYIESKCTGQTPPSRIWSKDNSSGIPCDIPELPDFVDSAMDFCFFSLERDALSATGEGRRYMRGILCEGPVEGAARENKCEWEEGRGKEEVQCVEGSRGPTSGDVQVAGEAGTDGVDWRR